MKYSLIPLLFCLLPACGQDATSPGKWSITPVAKPIVTEGSFAGNADMSGGATLDGTGFLMVSNETRCAQIARLTRDPWRLTVGAQIPLNPPQGGDECDFEAVAVDPTTQFYYVLGSHGVSKKKGHSRPEQEALFRLPVDPATKLPAPNQATPPPSVSLRAWLQQVPGIGDSVGKPLQLNGLSLEGLACRQGNLFIGCRSPHRNGEAAILEIAASVLFSHPPTAWPQPTIHWLPLGKGLGVRDLAPVQNGFLVLAGDSGVVTTPKYPVSENYTGDKEFSLFLWQPGQPEKVTRLGLLPGVKASAEALIVLDETPDIISILILHDGAYNGGPVLYSLSKPR